MLYCYTDPVRQAVPVAVFGLKHRMADKTANHEKDYTYKCSPSEVDHPDLNKLPADDVPDKVPGEKARNGDQNIDKDRKNIPAKDQVGYTAVKCRDQQNKKDRLKCHTTLPHSRNNIYIKYYNSD